LRPSPTTQNVGVVALTLLSQHPSFFQKSQFSIVPLFFFSLTFSRGATRKRRDRDKTRVVKVSLALRLETPRIIKRTKMLKILEWAKEWVRSWPPGPACYFCNASQSDEPRFILFRYDDLPICTDCLRLPSTFGALDSMYWDEYPEAIPLCRHCRKVVPPDQLEQAVRTDWYFCQGCAYESDVILYWKRIRRRLWKRRAKELGLRKW